MGLMRTPSAAMLQKARTVLGAVPGAAAALPQLYETVKPMERVPAPDGNAPLAYCLLGAPGVGKGTYSSKLSQWLGVPHVSTGELVRAEIKRKTEFGRQVCIEPKNLKPNITSACNLQKMLPYVATGSWDKLFS
jgi:Adenylate kinase